MVFRENLTLLFQQISTFGKHIFTIQNYHNGVDYLRLYLTDKPNKIYNKAIKRTTKDTSLSF